MTVVRNLEPAGIDLLSVSSRFEMMLLYLLLPVCSSIIPSTVTTVWIKHIFYESFYSIGTFDFVISSPFGVSSVSCQSNGSN